ncbi:hypothetical protein GF325_17910 [Candidatus Bathyarchaeota archaeon]|nr:hypothetical protein [Candidatus Bathyarchaeota archaeon]
MAIKPFYIWYSNHQNRDSIHLFAGSDSDMVDQSDDGGIDPDSFITCILERSRLSGQPFKPYRQLNLIETACLVLLGH